MYDTMCMYGSQVSTKKKIQNESEKKGHLLSINCVGREVVVKMHHEHDEFMELLKSLK